LSDLEECMSLNHMGVKPNFFLFLGFLVFFLGIEMRMSLNRMGVNSNGEPRITGDVTVSNSQKYSIHTHFINTHAL
jgi:hypothetical protein